MMTEKRKMKIEKATDESTATVSQVAEQDKLLRLQIKPKRAELLVLPWRIHGHSISDGIASSFFRKKKIRDYFYEIGSTSYESK